MLAWPCAPLCPPRAVCLLVQDTLPPLYSQDRSADVRKLAQVMVTYVVQSCGYAAVEGAVDHLRVKPAAQTSIRASLAKLRDTAPPMVWL
jgi:hypothetical protein